MVKRREKVLGKRKIPLKSWNLFSIDMTDTKNLKFVSWEKEERENTWQKKNTTWKLELVFFWLSDITNVAVSIKKKMDF